MAAAFAVLAATGAQAQQRPPGEITVINARAAPMTSIEIATTGDNPRLVARHVRPVAPGASVKVRLNGARGCTYVVVARFADDSEAADDAFNLCGERQIRLTEE